MTAASDLDLIFLYDFDERCRGLGRRAAAARRAVLHAPDPAADRGALGADGRGHALRGRLPPAPLRQVRAARHPSRRLRRLPGQGGLDLGAHGADARAADRRRRSADRARSTGDRQGAVAARATPKKVARRRPRDARPDRRRRRAARAPGTSSRRRAASSISSSSPSTLQLVHAQPRIRRLISTETEAVLVAAARAGLLPRARGRDPAAGAPALPGAHPDPPALRRRPLRPRRGAARPARPAGAGRRAAGFRDARRAICARPRRRCAASSSG